MTAVDAFMLADLRPPVPLAQIPLAEARPSLVPPFLPDGEVSIFFGPGGAGKSYLALAIGMSIAADREILPGVIPSAQGGVVIFDFERQETQWRRRAEWVAAGAGMAIPDSLYYKCVRHHDIASLDLPAMVSGIPNLKLAVLDSVEASVPASAANADPNDRFREVMTSLLSLETTVLALDHPSKSETARPTPYGSVFKRNWSRGVWSLRGDLATGVRVSHDKENDGPTHDDIGFQARFEDASVVFERTGHPAMTNPQRLEQYLVDQGGSAPFELVREHFTWEKDNLRQVISRAGERIRCMQGEIYLVTP